MSSSSKLLRWWPLALTLVLAGSFVRLAFWQLQRAGEKEAMLADFDRGQQSSPMQLVAWQPMPRFVSIGIDGQYLEQPVILLDNQIRDTRLGVYVLQLFRPDGGGPLMLVNRGWMAVDSKRRVGQVSRRSGALTLTGLLADPPRPGMRLGQVTLLDQAEPQRVPWIDLDDLSALLKMPLASQILLSTDKNDAGLIKQWQPQMMPADKHRAYALQWLCMAIAIVIIWLSLNRKQQRAADERD
jgi:cytochrome oxidase assembly protein ShyY1